MANHHNHMIKTALVLFTFSLLATTCAAQILQYPPYGSWRGRAVARQGLFNVQKYRWGGGITPTGGAVLTTLIPVIPEIIGATVPFARDDSSTRDSASRDATSRPAFQQTSGWSEYAAEQRRATDLLLKLDRLSGGNLSTSGGANTGVSGGGTTATFEKLTPAQIQQKYGSDPW